MVLIALKAGVSPLYTVAIYAVVQCAYHAAYLASVCRIAGVPMRRYLLLLLLVAANFPMMWGLRSALSLAGTSPLVIFCIQAISGAAIAALALLMVRQTYLKRGFA